MQLLKTKKLADWAFNQRSQLARRERIREIDKGYKGNL